jgi:phytanoyl-CoA hydroxylase
MVMDYSGLKYSLRSQGYAVARCLFDAADLKSISSATSAMIEEWYGGRRDDPDFWHFVPEGRDPVLYRIHNLEKNKHHSVGELVNSPRLRSLVENLYGSRAEPTAHALIVKIPSRSCITPWHRDPVAVPPCSVYNFSVSLDDSSSENGCLEVLPGSHLFPADYPVGAERPEGSVAVPTRVGDVAIHDVRLIHGSGVSTSPRIRRSVVVEFCPDWIIELRARGDLST